MRPSPIFKRLWALAALLALAGCYDGWHRPPGVGGPGPGINKPMPTEKPIGLVLLDTFVMSSDAMKSRACSPEALSLVELRQGEAALRIKNLAESLGALADTVRIHQIQIEKGDCTLLKAVENRARNADPADFTGLDPALKLKPALYARAVIWNGDFSQVSPSDQVTWNPWAAMTALDKSGFKRALAVTHFAITGPRSGYVSDWRRNSYPPGDRNIAVTIENPAIDESGAAAIADFSAKSAADFTGWVLRRVQGL